MTIGSDDLGAAIIPEWFADLSQGDLSMAVEYAQYKYNWPLAFAGQIVIEFPDKKQKYRGGRLLRKSRLRKKKLKHKIELGEVFRGTGYVDSVNVPEFMEGQMQELEMKVVLL